jgi:uncharacterized protein
MRNYSPPFSYCFELKSIFINICFELKTVFINQIRNSKGEVHLAEKGDFMVNGKYVFEVGGKNKGFDQIKDLPNSYLALDEIETGFGKKIPLWLFGFLY